MFLGIYRMGLGLLVSGKDTDKELSSPDLRGGLPPLTGHKRSGNLNLAMLA
jgi:hypothetical protein